MNRSKKIFLTFILLLIPIIVIAQEVEQAKKMPSFTDMLFASKYIVGFILAIIGLALIWTKSMTLKFRIPLLLVSFAGFAIYFSLHPSPICSFTKPFIYGLQTPFLAGITFIGVLSIISTKGFCGTICPAGALQELLFRIPILKNAKKNKFPFKVSNTIRTVFAVVFLIVAIAFGITIFGYINLFEIFHWSLEMPVLNLIIFLTTTVILLLMSLVFFRPFCYLVCPVGLITWVLEQFAPAKIQFNKSKCTDCGTCETEVPCTAIPDILNNRKIRADCYLCGDCVNECPEDALTFGIKSK
ncbi:MAG: 4Fe-4S binding protein [Melioribacteraceae bacterium]|nr:4Fe-4S binding protein [Melioribacteraceae bacterium]MCF8353866.1 4Fe-4S binding protein [Melioribacteraceae bacterium]MCF8393099.1 4Fe-4S binding protein [Melioribacteraceae bacterium]MCF8419218.1 4Fe-4S binding protein [Melioribacteraceae bacterium]